MKLFAVAVAVIAVGMVSAAPTISDSLSKAYQTKDTNDIMVILKEKTATVLDAVNSMNFPNTNDKATYLVKQLKEFTSQSQARVLSTLTKAKSTGKVTPFYITNRVSVKNAPLSVVHQMLELDEVEEVRLEKVLHILNEPVQVSPRVLEWGVERVNAPPAWSPVHPTSEATFNS